MCFVQVCSIKFLKKYCTPNLASGPELRENMWTLQRLRFSSASAVAPPQMPAPSAMICSSSCVAPPVTSARMSARAFTLKYAFMTNDVLLQIITVLSV